MKKQIPVTQEILALAPNISHIDHNTYSQYLNGGLSIKPLRVTAGYGLALIDKLGKERVRGFGNNFINALRDLLDNFV